MKTNRIPRSLKKNEKINSSSYFSLGDLVAGDFENEYVTTFKRASENHTTNLHGDGPLFYKNDIGLVVDLLETPDSFYDSGFCRLLMNSGELGWLPRRWLKRTNVLSMNI
jgi:hypothetical protein